MSAILDFMAKLGVGQYPPGYDKKVHGPYNPARYYGPADKPLGEVKLNELGSWLARRNKTPLGIARFMSRGYHRWAQKYMGAKSGGLAGFTQMLIGIQLFFYLINYPKYTSHRNYKYHW